MKDAPALKATPGFGDFLRILAEEGVAVVTPQVAVPTLDESAEQKLRAMAGELSQELAGAASEFSAAAALWAARMLYQMCRFVACRDLGEPELVAALAERCPVPRGSATDWSVDLTFRVLPEVIRAARQLSNGDPLVREMRRIASEWPLSSVGVAELTITSIETFARHPALLQLYVDRILEAEDVSRLDDAQTAEAVRATLGAHPELCPSLAAKVFPQEAASAVHCTSFQTP